MTPQLSELDVQNLRHLLGGYDTSCCKMTEYANQASDQQIKQSAKENKQQLMHFLG